MRGLFRNERGSITVITAISMLMVLSSLFLAVNTGKYMYDQNYCESAADAIALSLATWESRGLNTIATLNWGMEKVIRHIRSILLLWASSIGLALAGHPALFFRLSRRAPGVIRKLWAAGVRFSDTAKRIKKALPLLVLSSFKKLLGYYGVKGFVYPFLPGIGKRAGGSSLRLCLEEGEPLTLFDVVRTVGRKARGFRPKKRWKRKFYRYLSKIFFSSLSFLFQLKGEIVPQVLEEEFEKRQVVYILAVSHEKTPFFSGIFNRNYRNYGVACAKPWGGGAGNAAWKSKLITPDPGVVRKVFPGGKI